MQVFSGKVVSVGACLVLSVDHRSGQWPGETDDQHAERSKRFAEVPPKEEGESDAEFSARTGSCWSPGPQLANESAEHYALRCQAVILHSFEVNNKTKWAEGLDGPSGLKEGDLVTVECEDNKAGLALRVLGGSSAGSHKKEHKPAAPEHAPTSPHPHSSTPATHPHAPAAPHAGTQHRPKRGG